MQPDLLAALGTHDVLRRRDHPDLAREVDRAFAAGELVRLLPGRYATPRAAMRLEGRARAVHLLDPDAVVTGTSTTSPGRGSTPCARA
ncbi:MAG TPA: hypothetical protein GXZ45_14215 [Propionibacterium sp.]|nr:hypothetical protein [Propionibacterium sp.]